MTATAETPKLVGGWRSWRWAVLALIAIAVVAALTALLVPTRVGGSMDPEATSPMGARALVTLLRDQGVDVVVAHTAEQARDAARSDSALLVAQTPFLNDPQQWDTLAQAPGDRIIVEPGARTREALAPGVRVTHTALFATEPDCDLREARRAGEADLGSPDSYKAVSDDIALTRCYGGAVVRYRDGDRTITVVGSADFMTNAGLLQQGNAALAMNLAGTRPRLIWYAPQRAEGANPSGATITDLIPQRVNWIVWQLCLTVGLVALWRGRRLGPLVAERLPVVVRASETVEGRGRLYRSRRARDRAAEALRTATVQRLTPRLGLAANTEPGTLSRAIAARGAGDPDTLRHLLFGPPPATDADLVALAHALDDMERQVAQS